MDEYLTIDELAALLKVPVRTIYDWNHRSVGPPAFKLGRHLRYSAAEVTRWMETRRVA